MEFSRKVKTRIVLEGTVLENVDNIKYLGVTITNDLKLLKFQLGKEIVMGKRTGAHSLL